jgi:D-lactate dehydrogenase
MITELHQTQQASSLPHSGVLLLTEANASLTDRVRTALPGLAIQSVPGTLDITLVSSPEEVSCLWITVRSQVGAQEMDALPNLRLIATGSAGFDHIYLDAARERNIRVAYVPDYGPAVAEFNIALMLALSRKLHKGHIQTLQNEFDLSGLLGRNLQGQTLAVVGAGTIGLKVLELAKAFGMRLLAVDPSPKGGEADRIGFEFVSLGRAISEADILCLCCPLTEATRHLIGQYEFERMKPGMLLVNTSRGLVIDGQALMWALNRGIVAGAALDVLECETTLTHDGLTEALAADPSQETAQALAEDLTLMRHPNVLVTPHMAYYTRDSLDSIIDQTAANIRLFFHGMPQNLVV